MWICACMPVHTQVGDLQVLCVCEGEWGIVSNGKCVYCSQMWTGMWRVGMQWLLEPSRPSFSPLSLPFVPTSFLALPKTPLMPLRPFFLTSSLSTMSCCWSCFTAYVSLCLCCVLHKSDGAFCDIVCQCMFNFNGLVPKMTTDWEKWPLKVSRVMVFLNVKDI